MKTVAIIQARMGSSRLPNKVLMEIEKKPMLWHIVQRVSSAKLLDDVVIATSRSQRDRPLEKFARENKFKLFKGAENNCLDRYYKAAKASKADAIVRITGDCPLICPEVIDKVLSEYSKGKHDYVANTLFYTYPDGCDVEVFSFKALEKAWKECKDRVGKEHVTPYLRNSSMFKLKNVESETPVDPKDYKWSVDRLEDLNLVREVYKHLYTKQRDFSMNAIFDLVKKHPYLKKINSETIVNEGYYKSFLKAEKIRPKKIRIAQSLALKKRARRLIPGCSQTFSKAPSQFVQGIAPVFLEKGSGSHVWDVDGNEYIDYSMALGPIILGYNYPLVTRAVKVMLEKGVTFTLPHRLEGELAEMLCELIPCAEMVRYGKNGSDVTSAAVRVARAYTSRDKIACCGYHGWQDWYIATTTRNKGIPQAVKDLTLTFNYNDIESLKKLFTENKNQIACVIMEPVGVVEPKDNFLEKVKELTHKNGALLIFDEVVTGFRFSLGGAQTLFGVVPDLACFGKAMGNGFPISTVVGRRKILKLFEEVFFSFTFGGEILSIAASIVTIKELKKKNVIQYLWKQGRKLKDGYNVLVKAHQLERYTECTGFSPRTIIMFRNREGATDLLLKSLFQQECIKRGILFTGGQNMCFSHSDSDIERTLRVYNSVLEIVKRAIKQDKVRKLIKGEIVKPIFRKA
ncbi:MAG: aminotransferase class III-fold pyridoxal phosphate-dependent enzyme [Candidatus Omnitrophica bacterium]|nr:aminotransferase class III-fold pyridoxal phosphate-dependent enzyme [Candidatus Omnitrophota bacterium]